MKIRLEPEKTSLRISKTEFKSLLSEDSLSCKTTFPNGKTMAINVSLADEEALSYQCDTITVALPNQRIRGYTPGKMGLSFYFEIDNTGTHELLFEVDIKKKPLGSQRLMRS